MQSLKELKVQYITNESGEKTAVVLPIADFQELMEDLAVVVERREEPIVRHEKLIAELKRDGLLSD
jgi:hypothetical protein